MLSSLCLAVAILSARFCTALPSNSYFAKPECGETLTSAIDEPFQLSTTLQALSLGSLQQSTPSGESVNLTSTLQRLSAAQAQQDPRCVVTIPVQFNNWHTADSTDRMQGYISDELFSAAIDRLNANYAALSSIRFSIANINRIPISATEWQAFTTTSSDMSTHETISEQIKGPTPSQESVRTMQVNILNDAVACGFTYVPSQRWSPSGILRDGVYLDTKCFDGHPLFRPSTFTHETAHWLGLYHTFEGGCTGQGDLVNDTPPADTPSSTRTLVDDCTTPPAVTSCGDRNSTAVTVSLANYMSYSIDSCRTEFTAGQVDRMYAIIRYAREIPIAC